MKSIKVRITKTWHLDVEAEYGDTEQTIKAKALATLDEVEPDEHVQVNIVPAASDG